MNRRRLLRAAGAPLAAGLAGCPGLRGDEPPAGDADGGQRLGRSNGTTATPTGTETPADDPTTSDTPTGTETPTSPTTVRVADTSPVRDAPVRYEVSMARPSATRDHPPVLRTRITNTRDAVTRLGEERPAQHRYVGPEDGALVLLGYGGLGDRRYRVPAAPGCWRLQSSPLHLDYYGTLELAPGETRTVDSPVYGGPSLPDDVCLPAGDHRIEPRVFWTGADGVPDADDARVDWAFTLRVEAER